MAEPVCRDCKHYGDHGGRGGGTPPWPVCLFGAEPATCQRFQDHMRPAYAWATSEERARREAALREGGAQ